MRILARLLLLWLPVVGTLAQTPRRDLDLEMKSWWPGFARGPARAVTLSGNYAYVAYTYQGDWTTGLQVIDISNPTNPQRLGAYDTTGAISDVAVSGNFAYLARAHAGLGVI